MKPFPPAAAALVLMLSACASKIDVITPEVQAGMMSDLQAGKLNLDCGLNCRLTWEASRAQIHALDLAENWNALTVQVMKIGYGNDLAYYYLGQAAQGLGYHPAAISYYNYALSLSTGTNPLLKCSAGQSDGNDPCQGVDIAASVPVLITASETALAAQRAAAAQASAAPVHHRKKKPAATPATASRGSGWLAPPPPTQASASSATPAATPAAATGGGSGWLAPPPPPAQ